MIPPNTTGLVAPRPFLAPTASLRRRAGSRRAQLAATTTITEVHTVSRMLAGSNHTHKKKRKRKYRCHLSGELSCAATNCVRFLKRRLSVYIHTWQDFVAALNLSLKALLSQEKGFLGAFLAPFSFLQFIRRTAVSGWTPVVIASPPPPLRIQSSTV